MRCTPVHEFIYPVSVVKNASLVGQLRVTVYIVGTPTISVFAILLIMSPNIHIHQPNGQDRREYYRINVTLPIILQSETDDTEGEFTKKSVNLSGGGISVVVDTLFQAGEILSCNLLLPGQVLFKSPIEVLRLVPIAHPDKTYRLHARFIRMTAQNRELLITYVLQFQRYHLARHYSV